MSVGAVLVAPFAVITASGKAPGARAVIAVIVLGLVCTAVTYRLIAEFAWTTCSLAFVALLDANVLYHAYLWDALLRLAEVYRVRWSRQSLDEMSRNVLENNPDLPGENVERLVRIMERAFPGP